MASSKSICGLHMAAIATTINRSLTREARILRAYRNTPLGEKHHNLKYYLHGRPALPSPSHSVLWGRQRSGRGELKIGKRLSKRLFRKRGGERNEPVMGRILLIFSWFAKE
jgi:hypothetical protein